MNRTIATIAVIALVLLAGCGAPSDQAPTPEPDNGSENTDKLDNLERLGDNPDTGFYRYYDEETQTVCFISYEGGSAGSIDCLPVNESGVSQS